jgi:hypothetical protein
MTGSKVPEVKKVPGKKIQKRGEDSTKKAVKGKNIEYAAQ